MSIVSEQRNSVDPINFIRVLAVIIIYMLHTAFCSQKLGNIWESGKWTFILETPAWGGVWIFFILSGYLSGKGFATRRYTLKAKDIKIFYLKKIVNVWLPTIFFIFLCFVLIYPDYVFKNPNIIIKFLTCTYKGGDDTLDVINVTWFTFTLMWLYLIVPFVCFIMHKVKQKQYAFILYLSLCVVIIAGLSYRIVAHFYWELNFYTHIYTAPYANLDLFIFGIILSFITVNREENTINDNYAFKLKNNYVKLISTVLLMALILLNCWIFYMGSLFAYRDLMNIKAGLLRSDTEILLRKIYLQSYGLIFPSLYICCIGLFLYAFDYKHNIPNLPVNFQNIKNNLFRLIDWFSGFSLGFYLFHSLILKKIYTHITGSTPLILHFKLLIIAGIITTIFAYGYSRIFKKAFNN